MSCVVPIQARSPVSPKGLRRLSSSNELGAQYVSPHQTTKRKKTTPEGRVPAFFQGREMMSCRCKGCGSSKKTEVSGSSEVASLNRGMQFSTGFIKGPQEQRDIPENG